MKVSIIMPTYRRAHTIERTIETIYAQTHQTWVGSSYAADQRYYRAIQKAHGWTKRKGDIVSLPDILCRATTDPRGGLREGKF